MVGSCQASAKKLLQPKHQKKLLTGHGPAIPLAAREG